MKILNFNFLNALFLAVTIIFISACKKGEPKLPASITDIEGNSYNVITIGSQTWMAENLKTTKLKDGTSIPIIGSSVGWAYRTDSAMCWLDNDEIANKNTYGALYNWYTIRTHRICPTGWHVPSDAEWTELITYIGGDEAGGKLKETGITHWESPNQGATDEFNFKALPAGSRNGTTGIHLLDGIFYGPGASANWWSDTELDRLSAWSYYLVSNSIKVSSSQSQKQDGFSLRCIKD